MKNLLVVVVSVVSAVTVLSACSYEEMKGMPREAPVITQGEINFKMVSEAVLMPACAKCHSGPNAKAGVDVTSLEGMIESGAVLPGEPNDSFLLMVVESGDMPPKGPLSDDQIMMLRKWIEQGAKT